MVVFENTPKRPHTIFGRRTRVSRRNPYCGEMSEAPVLRGRMDERKLHATRFVEHFLGQDERNRVKVLRTSSPDDARRQHST